MMLLDKVVMVNISRKHRMNVVNSTETELVSVTDVLDVILWYKYFMEAQRYTLESNVLCSDDNLTILRAYSGTISA